MLDTQLYLLLDIYNDAVGTVSWKYQIRLKYKKALKNYPWYQDLVNLYNIIHSVGAKPREFIRLQLDNYNRPSKFSRAVPTIKMMTTFKAMEIWENSQKRVAPIPELSKEYLLQVSKKHMENLMRSNNIVSEEEFFKDPYLIQLVSKIFLAESPIVNKLLDEGYYFRLGFTRENLVGKA